MKSEGEQSSSWKSDDADLSRDEFWCIGLFEGEGSIVVHKRNGEYRATACLSVCSTDEDVVAKVHAITGLGKISGPYNSNSNGKANPKWRSYWYWRANSAIDIKQLLDKWMPYLSTRRREQANIALVYLSKNHFIARPNKCPNGHELGEGDYYKNRNPRTGKTYGYCKRCHAERVRKYRQNKKT